MKPNIGLSVILIVVVCSTGHSQLNMGLKAYYPFEGDPTDHSGHTNDGLVFGNVMLTTDRTGTENCAYYFLGTADDFIHVHYSSDFNIEPDGAFSISLWYQGGSIDKGDFEVLVEKVNPAVSPHPSDYNLGLYDLNKPGIGSNYIPIASSYIYPPIPDTDWHHLVGIYNARNWYIYLDNLPGEHDESEMYPIFQSEGYLTIGSNFEGKIDDIRFYDRMLSVSEISQLYGLSGSCVSTLNKDISDDTFHAFPNPTSGIVYLHFPDNSSAPTYTLYNTFGSIATTVPQLDERATEIDLSGCSNGIYFLEVRTVQKTKVVKIIKQ